MQLPIVSIQLDALSCARPKNCRLVLCSMFKKSFLLHSVKMIDRSPRCLHQATTVQHFSFQSLEPSAIFNSVLASSFFISQLPSLTDRVLKKVLIVFLLISQNPWFATTAVISLTHRGMKHVDSVLSFLSSLLVAKHKINPVVQELWHVIWFQGLKKREQRFKPPLKT